MRDCSQVGAPCLVISYLIAADHHEPWTFNALKQPRGRIHNFAMRSVRPRTIGKLLSPAAPVGRRLQPSWVRYNSQVKADPAIQPPPKADSSEAPAAPAGDSSMIRQEDASEGTASHRSGFHAPVDHGTSYGTSSLYTTKTMLTVCEEHSRRSRNDLWMEVNPVTVLLPPCSRALL